MSVEELYPEESRSLESLRHMRLMALLRDMIDDKGKVKAAEALGVNYRTLVRAEESEQLTARMSSELERYLLLGGGSAAAQQRKSIKTLEERVTGLEEELESGLEELRRVIDSGIRALREERTQGLNQLERRIVKVEEGPGGSERVGEEKPSEKTTWRPYRDVVTLESEPGEERVYGDATPLIAEWRKVRAEFLGAVDKLSRSLAKERMLELEIELIGECELTLPPRTYPWDSSDRRDEVWRRTQTLERIRERRARVELWMRIRRVLTLSFWRH